MKKNRVELKTFLDFNFFSDVMISPDGNKIAYIKKKSNIVDNDYDKKIYIYDIVNKKNFKLTNTGNEEYFKWLNNEEIVFDNCRTKEEKEKSENNLPYTNLYKININGGEAEKLMDFSLFLNDLEYIDENNILLLANYNHFIGDIQNLSDDKIEELKDKVKEEQDYEVFDEIPFWHDGVGITNKLRDVLYKYNLKEKKYEMITPALLDIHGYELVKKYDFIIYSGELFSDKMIPRDSIFLYDLITGKNYLLLDIDYFRIDYVNVLDDKIIISAIDVREYGLDANNKFYTLDLNKFIKNRNDDKFINKYSIFNEDLLEIKSINKYKNKNIYADNDICDITPKEFDYSIGVSGVASDITLGESYTYKIDGKYLYFVFLNRIYEAIGRIDINGNIEVVYQSCGSIAGFDVNNNEIYAILQLNQKLQEIYKININPKVLRRIDELDIASHNENGNCDYIDYNVDMITNFNEEISEKLNIIKPLYINFKSDNNIIDAWILIPNKYCKKNLSENKKIILNIHGGPKYAYSDIYYNEMQQWVNEGYYVIFCNPRGSDGRGNKFSDVRDNYAIIDYYDLKQFIKYIEKLKLKKLDFSKEKLEFGITGGSYGGYMTNWFIGNEPDLFKAAVSQRCVTNWVSAFNIADIDYFATPDTFSGADVWNDMNKLWNFSPIKYANKVKTPTLFLHSEEDYRCHITEGIQMFHALKYHNVKSKLVIFKEESHGLSRNGKPKHRIRRLKEIIDWFNDNM